MISSASAHGRQIFTCFWCCWERGSEDAESLMYSEVICRPWQCFKQKPNLCFKKIIITIKYYKIQKKKKPQTEHELKRKGRWAASICSFCLTHSQFICCAGFSVRMDVQN